MVGGSLSQTAVIHTQIRIKGGPLAATSYIEYKGDFMERFWKLPSHNPHSRYCRSAMGSQVDARWCGSFDKCAWLFENLGFKEVVQDASSKLLVLAGVGRSSPFSFVFP